MGQKNEIVTPPTNGVECEEFYSLSNIQAHIEPFASETYERNLVLLGPLQLESRGHTHLKLISYDKMMFRDRKSRLKLVKRHIFKSQR